MQITNINGLDRILCDHDDGMIVKTIVYSDLVNVPGVEDIENINLFYAYADAECPRKCTASELVDAFLKGCVIFTGGTYMHPSKAMDIGIIAVADLPGSSLFIAGDTDLSGMF